MKLVEVNWRPTDRHLRQFAAAALVALPLLAWLWGGGPRTVVGMAIVGSTLVAVSFVVPRVLKPVYLAATLVTLPIGMVVGEVALLAMFYGVFVPIGCVFRVIGRDAMDRRFDRAASTYWKPKPQPHDAGSYFRMS